MKKSTRILTMAALCASCASQRALADPRHPKPDWVDGASVEYPRERYVVGVGAGDDRAAAQDRARAEIAKVFSTNVSIDTRMTETETSDTGDGASKNNFSRSINQSVKTASEKALEGVQVVEDWHDSATKIHYAMAVLERVKARAAINDKIGELDSQAAQWKSQLESATEKLPKAKAAMRLLTILKARSELNSELRVVDDNGQGVTPFINEAAIKSAAAKAVSALNVSVVLLGEGSNEVITAVLSGLNACGLQASIGHKDADISVEGQVDTKPMQGDDGRWLWARSTATISLNDPRTGKVFSRFDASDREASADYEEAARRSHVELAKRVSNQISASITTYFENN